MKKVTPDDSNFPWETTTAFIRSSDLDLFPLNLMNIIICMRRSELIQFPYFSKGIRLWAPYDNRLSLTQEVMPKLNYQFDPNHVLRGSVLYSSFLINPQQLTTNGSPNTHTQARKQVYTVTGHCLGRVGISQRGVFMLFVIKVILRSLSRLYF